MNIIFLDIEGVLYTDRYVLERKSREDFDIRTFDKKALDPKCVHNLMQIIDRTNAKIVISSDWRLGGSESLNALQEMFGKYEFKNYIIGRTPILYQEDLIKKQKRGKEIEYWIKSAAKKGLQVDNFIIIDDDTDMCELITRLVRTEQINGLTSELAEAAIAMFNEKTRLEKSQVKLMNLSKDVLSKLKSVRVIDKNL